MPAGLITPRSLVQIQPSLLYRDLSLENRDLGNPESNTLAISDNNNKTKDNFNENLKELFKSTDSYHKIKFYEWLKNKKLSKSYIQSKVRIKGRLDIYKCQEYVNNLFER